MLVESLFLKGAYFKLYQLHKRGSITNVLISRHMSLVCWTIGLYMLQPSLVWWVPGRVQLGSALAPFPQLNQEPKTHLISWMYELARTETHYRPLLLVWETYYIDSSPSPHRKNILPSSVNKNKFPSLHTVHVNKCRHHHVPITWRLCKRFFGQQDSNPC